MDIMNKKELVIWNIFWMYMYMKGTSWNDEWLGRHKLAGSKHYLYIYYLYWRTRETEDPHSSHL